MSFVNAKYVHNVRGLLIPKNVDCDKIAKYVEDYIEQIPELTETMNSSLRRNRQPEFAAGIGKANLMLGNLRARWLQRDAEFILGAVNKGDMGMCGKKAPPFIANLLALSIEMQTAKSNYREDKKVNQNTIEFFDGILKYLETAQDFMRQSQTASAADILSNLSVLDDDEIAKSLIAALRSGNRPEDLMCELIDKYYAKIQQIWGEKSGNHKIMLVDDRPEILETVGGYLKDKYKVLPLTGGTYALKVLEKQTPDLFVLDIDMPDMDGITLAKRIRATAGYENTPIIILTSNATKDYVLAAMQAGTNDFIVKPANREMLLAKISTYLM